MKRTVFTWIFIFLGSQISFGQPEEELLEFNSALESEAFEEQNPLKLLLAVDAEVNIEDYEYYQNYISDISQKLSNKREKWGDEVILKKMFYHIHSKDLKWYDNYVTLSELFEKGTYDCLTGTALYALILEELEIPYTIQEFDFHVLTIVHLDDKDIILESTDHMFGFIASEAEVNNHLAKYFAASANKEGYRTVIGSQAKVTKGSVVNLQISLKELVGLQYYNLAINAYNSGNVSQSRKFINKAAALHPSDRIIDTKNYMYSTIPVAYLNQ